MQRVFVALSVALVLTPRPAWAQPLQSFQDLALRINLEDRIRVEDQSGATTAGRLTRLTRDEMTLETGTGERRLASATIRSIHVHRRPLRKAVLIGAGVGAVLGALAGCAGPDREQCAVAPMVLGALGAGLGLATGALALQSATVYRAPIDTGPRGAAASPGPFDEVALRVDLGDRLRIEEVSGARTTGRLVRLTGDEMAIQTDAGERRFASGTVRAVAVRRYPLRRGALVGAIVLPVLLAASPACRSDPDCMPIAAAPIGAGVGLAIGALVPRMATVFRTDEPRASLSPVFSRGAMGVRLGLRW